MIRLENVCFAYEKEIALRYVDLHINRGDSIVIQGPNGCGKSTLIKLLNGIIFPSEGKYFYQGHEINEKALKNSQFAKWFHQQMGYVLQNADAQLFCGSVEEEIAFGPVQMGLSEAEIKKRTEDCLHLFGLEKLRDRPPYHLSGGEKRKVSLEKTQDMLVDFLQSFHKAGKTLITITHNRQLAETIGTRFACMNEEHELKILS